MGTIQQVTMGAVCLGAAFAFGSYINRPPVDALSPTQAEGQTDQGLRSLIEPDLVAQKRPAKTPWMKPKLAARLPMPSLPATTDFDGPLQTSNAELPFGNDGFLGTNQFGNRSAGDEIPPPSDLTGRGRNSVAKVAIVEPVIEAAPDFSGGLNAVSSMPVISDRSSMRSPNLVDSFESNDENFGRVPATTAIVEKAPSFGPPSDALAGNVKSTKTIDRSVTTDESKSRWGIKPANQNLAPIDGRRLESFVAAPRSLQKEPAKFANQRPGDALGQSVLSQGSSTGLVPLPSLEQDTIAATSIEIVDPAAAFRGPESRVQPQARMGALDSGMTPLDPRRRAPTAVLAPETSGSDLNPISNSQRRVARLPFKLNSNARTRLTRLRDQTIEKISLGTTKFADHVVENGESLQAIATRYFGKPDFYLDIYMANRDRLKFPGDIRDGMVIRVPIYQ